MADDFWNTDAWFNPSNTAYPTERNTQPFTAHSLSQQPAVTVTSTSSVGNDPYTEGQNEMPVQELRSSTLDVPDYWWTMSDDHSAIHTAQYQNFGDDNATMAMQSASPFIDTVDTLEEVPQDQVKVHRETEDHASSVAAETTDPTESFRNPAEPRADNTVDQSSDSTSSGAPDESDTMIGSFHHNGRFKCLQPSCAHKSFKRQAELKRHYDTIHAVQKPEFWCRISSCPRSRASGGHPFPRRDKRRDHMRKVHGRS